MLIELSYGNTNLWASLGFKHCHCQTCLRPFLPVYPCLKFPNLCQVKTCFGILQLTVFCFFFILLATKYISFDRCPFIFNYPRLEYLQRKKLEQLTLRRRQVAGAGGGGTQQLPIPITSIVKSFEFSTIDISRNIWIFLFEGFSASFLCWLLNWWWWTDSEWNLFLECPVFVS